MCRIDDYDDYGGHWLEPLHEVKARKDHSCHDCGRIIAKGETYTYGSWISTEFDGVSSVKMCAHCVAAGKWLRDVCGGHMWPGVMEELVEHWDEERWQLGSIALGRLIILGRARWKRHGRLVDVDHVKDLVRQALTRVPEDALH